MKPRTYIAIAMVVTSSAVVATTADSPVGRENREAAKHFGQLDKDGDGALSKAEAKADAQLREQMPQIDSDRDGRITIEEFMAAQTGHGASGSGLNKN